MKPCILFLFLTIISCKNQQAIKEKALAKELGCKNGQMTCALYECGKDKNASAFPTPENEFLILVDTSRKATNFISLTENILRRQHRILDQKLMKSNDLNKSNPSQKECNQYKYRADSLHHKNNQGQQEVWIINKTKSDIILQIQDRSYICVLQAKTQKGEWHPIQYWDFAKCGNSYFTKRIAPNTASPFIAKLPEKGHFQTQLRFKILGLDKFYYSNTFDGKIHPCQFVENIDNEETNYKLEMFIKLI